MKKRERNMKGEQSTFNYSEHPCGVIAACCSNNEQSLFSLPTMKAADVAASLPSYSLWPQSLLIRQLQGKLAKLCIFFPGALQPGRICQVNLTLYDREGKKPGNCDELVHLSGCSPGFVHLRRDCIKWNRCLFVLYLIHYILL